MRLLICVLILIAVSCREEKPQQAYKTGMEGKPIPSFDIQLLDSVSYVRSDYFSRDKNLVLFYFSPTCPYCRAQMREMVNNIERFRDKELCILTNANLKSIASFSDYFKLQRLKNVIIGRDTGEVILKTYQLMTVPFTAYFDKNKELKVAYSGRLSSNTLFQ